MLYLGIVYDKNVVRATLVTLRAFTEVPSKAMDVYSVIVGAYLP